MLLAAATLIAISIAVVVVTQGRRMALDWHSQRGLSFLQLGLREIKRLCINTCRFLAWLTYLDEVPACPMLQLKNERI